MMPFIVKLKKDPNCTGVAISEQTHPLPDESGQKIVLRAVVAVLWDNQRSPAPSYHSPDELLWEDIPQLTALQDEYEDDDTIDDGTEDDDDEDDIVSPEDLGVPK
jgi:hypothetical protein